MFGPNDMTFGTVGHMLHRRRRAAFSHFFSKASVRRLEPVVQSLVDVLCEKLSERIDTGSPVDMVHAYSALTQDLLPSIASLIAGMYLRWKTFLRCITNSCRSQLRFLTCAIPLPRISAPISIACLPNIRIKQFPYMLLIMNRLPDWWVRATSPLIALLRAYQLEFTSQVQTILSHTDKTGSESHPTVFYSLRDDKDLPLSEKSLPRLVDEALSIVAAGTLTSMHMMSMTAYHILANPLILGRLVMELEKAMPDATTASSLQTLEQVPYLSAAINEGLRMSHGTVHRLQRVHPDNALIFQDWIITPGTPVGMDSLYLHSDPAVFPGPRKFDPSRWMGPEKEQRQKHLFNFGRGTRQCVGMNLALGEIHMTLATVLRRLGPKM